MLLLIELIAELMMNICEILYCLAHGMLVGVVFLELYQVSKDEQDGAKNKRREQRLLMLTLVCHIMLAGASITTLLHDMPGGEDAGASLVAQAGAGSQRPIA